MTTPVFYARISFKDVNYAQNINVQSVYLAFFLIPLLHNVDVSLESTQMGFVQRLLDVLLQLIILMDQEDV